MHAYFALENNTSIFIQGDSQWGKRLLVATQDHPHERCHFQAALCEACMRGGPGLPARFQGASQCHWGTA